MDTRRPLTPWGATVTAYAGWSLFCDAPTGVLASATPALSPAATALREHRRAAATRRRERKAWDRAMRPVEFPWPAL